MKEIFSKISKKIVVSTLLMSLVVAFVNFTSRETEASENSVLNVKDFGAKADGKTNDLEAIQKAIDEASQDRNRNTVYFPRGVYLVEEIIV
jgi:polygalacturonase